MAERSPTGVVADIDIIRKEAKLEELRILQRSVAQLLETLDTYTAPHGSASYGALTVLHSAAVPTSVLIRRDIERLERDA